MSVKISDIYTVLKDVFPMQLAENFDNCGLLIGDESNTCSKVIITLDITEAVIYEAELFGFCIPLYFRSAEGEDLKETVTPLKIFGTELPVSLRKTEYRHTYRETFTLTQVEAEERAFAQLAAIENEVFSGCIIRQRETAVNADPDGLTVTAVYEVEMDIARQQPISWQEPHA